MGSEFGRPVARWAAVGLRIALGSMCLAAILGITVHVQGQSESAASGFLRVRALIADGRYVQAEVAAENLLSSLQTSVGAIGDIEQAIDLFVEARVCNGKGGE